MSAKIIDGKSIAAEIKFEIKQKVAQLKLKNIVPGLATVLVGEDPASQVYVRSKHRACEEVGIASFNHPMPASTSEIILLNKIQELNQDPQVHAILVQLPLPKHIHTQAVLSAVFPEKDADGFHPENLGKLFAAKNMNELNSYKKPVPLPCTPHGVMALLKKIGTELTGKNAVVLGRSMIVGKPVAALLLAENATVTIAHSQTKNLLECCQQADILVVAVGQPEMVKSPMIKKDAIVIDVGINRKVNGSLCGDVDFISAQTQAGWITPVPGGVGPMTIVMLLENTLQLALSANGQ